MRIAPSILLDSAAPAISRVGRWPARLDVMEGVTGLVLALFMWGHMLFVSSILFGPDAMWAVSKFFEGYFFFGRSYPWIVSVVVFLVAVLIVVHALLAVRKFPSNYRQLRAIRSHARTMHHEDTTLWLWQVATGFALLFLASIHLHTMLTRPDRIGPFESADRIVTDHYWPLYLILLFVIEIHAGVGLYRLAVKWGLHAGRDPDGARRWLKSIKWAITTFMIVLGLATLAAYVKIGIDHAGHYGERYTPSWMIAPPPARAK